MAEPPDPPLPQRWPTPSRPRPIVVIGAGAIVEQAHLPAYRRLGFEVAGFHDLDPARSAALAQVARLDQRHGLQRILHRADQPRVLAGGEPLQVGHRALERLGVDFR
jgi:hypothetical protein